MLVFRLIRNLRVQEFKLMTSKKTVREALEGEPVNLGHLDRVEGAGLDDEIVGGMKLKVVRVKKKLVSENEIIMDKGDYRVIKEGKEGVREKVYVVSYEDGKEVGKQLVSSTVVSEPETRIVEYGTVPVYMTARGEKFRYKNPDHPEFGITYTGIRAKKGVVAPKVIPLGTKLYIEGIGGTDIGSAVKGNVIDLYMDSRQAVKQWGVKKVRVYILYD